MLYPHLEYFFEKKRNGLNAEKNAYSIMYQRFFIKKFKALHEKLNHWILMPLFHRTLDKKAMSKNFRMIFIMVCNVKSMQKIIIKSFVKGCRGKSFSL